jgi:hypothetical protein
MLKQDYGITIDQEATKYIGLTIEWDFKKQPSPHAYARVFRQSSHLFQTGGTKKEINLPHPHVPPKLWS